MPRRRCGRLDADPGEVPVRHGHRVRAQVVDGAAVGEEARRAARSRSGVATSARSAAPTRTRGRPGGSQRAQPSIGPAVVQSSAVDQLEAEPEEPGGSAFARRAASGSTQLQAGSSWNARASTRRRLGTCSARSRTISTAASLRPRAKRGRVRPGEPRRGSGGLDLEDLELERAARRRDLDDLALLVADDRLADRRLVRELVLGRVRLGRADDVVLEGLVRRPCPGAARVAPTDTVSFEISFFVITRADSSRSSSWAIRCSSIACSFFASSYSAFSAMSPNSRATRIRSATSRRLSVCRIVDLLLELLVAFGREDDFLQSDGPPDPVVRAGSGPKRARIVAARSRAPQESSATIHRLCRSTSASTGSSGTSRSRAASSSRRWQASACRRFAARAAATAPGSSAPRWSRWPGSSTATSGRSATCASPPTSTRSRSRSSAPTRSRWREAARMVEAAGADIVDINFGCPVKKVTKTGAGASLLDDPDHAARIVEAVATATPLPVSVKMRRGTENGSRACLDGRAAARRGRRGVADAAPALGEADVHRHRRPLADGRARLARRRAGDRLRRRHVARAGAGRARDDRRRRR